MKMANMDAVFDFIFSCPRDKDQVSECIAGSWSGQQALLDESVCHDALLAKWLVSWSVGQS